MKKLIKRIFRGKYYKNGESYVDTIVKVIICVVVGALLLTSVYAVAKSGLESAKNKVNDLLDYNPNGEDGPGGGDTSIPDGEDGPGGGDTSIPDGEDGPGGGDTSIPDGEDGTGGGDTSIPDGEDGPGGGDTSIPGGDDEPEPEEPMKPYLTFQSDNLFTISVASPKWNGTMQYSTDTVNWFTWNGSEITSVDGKLYLRGTGNTRVSADYLGVYSQFLITGTAVECVGNIETLLDWQAVVDGQHPIMNTNCFIAAFSGCTALIKAPALPATTLASQCYFGMFSGCTSLTTAPELPATTLADYCYYYMFFDCTALTTAPELPATTLANDCYSFMFEGCTSLTTPPALPATTLASSCYAYMFKGCTSLTTAPALPATTLARNCYDNMFNGCTNLKVSATQTGAYQYELRIPTEGTISSTAPSWNKNMFTNTGGTFTGSPTKDTTYYLEYPPVG